MSRSSSTKLNLLGLTLERKLVFKFGELRSSKLSLGLKNNMDLSMMETLTLSYTLITNQDPMLSPGMSTFG